MAKKLIGIDLGTSYIRIYREPDGIIMRMPSFVAVDKRTREVVATGSEAKMMRGKTPANITVFNPIKDGLISDYDATVHLLDSCFRQINAKSLFSRPQIVVTIPVNCNEVASMAVESAMLTAGARAVAVIESPLAAAIGAGLNVSAAKGCMTVDLGGGNTEIGIISAGGLVDCNICKTSGENLDRAIQHYIKQRKNLIIGDNTAELIKRQLISALPGVNRGGLIISGRNERTGLAGTAQIFSSEVYEATHGMMSSINRYISATVEGLAAEVSSDIYEFGIMLTGGCALIPGMAQFISNGTGFRTTIAANPLDCTIAGLGKLIADPSLINETFEFKT